MDITMEQKKQYQKRVEQVCPQTNLLTGCLKAFVVGGLICVLGQMINTWIMNFGADRQLAATWTSISLIFLGSFLTGAGWYDNLGKFAGAGSIFSQSQALPMESFPRLLNLKKKDSSSAWALRCLPSQGLCWSTEFWLPRLWD